MIGDFSPLLLPCFRGKYKFNLKQCFLSISESEQFLDLSTESLHLLLNHVFTGKDLLSSAISEDLKQKFVSALQKEFTRERVPIVLTPFLYPNLDLSMDKLNQEQSSNMAKNLVSIDIDFIFSHR